MNQSQTEAEVMLAAVARAARAEYERRDSAELSSEAFAELRAGELEALASQVLERWPVPGAPSRRFQGWLRPGLVGLAAVAASVLALGLWWQEGALDPAPASIAKEPVALPRITPVSPDTPVRTAPGASSWLPDAAGWQCTDSAFIEAGRSDGEPSTPGGAPALWLNVRPGYGDTGATLLNRMAAEPFRGQRLRLQARLGVIDVSDSAGLWLRVDGEGGQALAGARSVRRLSGSHDSELLGVTVDVPPGGEEIVFGAQLSGVGQLTIQDVVLELFSTVDENGPSARERATSAAAPPPLGALRKRPLRPVP